MSARSSRPCSSASIATTTTPSGELLQRCCRPTPGCRLDLRERRIRQSPLLQAFIWAIPGMVPRAGSCRCYLADRVRAGRDFDMSAHAFRGVFPNTFARGVKRQHSWAIECLLCPGWVWLVRRRFAQPPASGASGPWRTFGDMSEDRQLAAVEQRFARTTDPIALNLFRQLSRMDVCDRRLVLITLDGHLTGVSADLIYARQSPL
jgi:hypothetical protein